MTTGTILSDRTARARHLETWDGGGGVCDITEARTLIERAETGGWTAAHGYGREDMAYVALAALAESLKATLPELDRLAQESR